MPPSVLVLHQSSARPATSPSATAGIAEAASPATARAVLFQPVVTVSVGTGPPPSQLLPPQASLLLSGDAGDSGLGRLRLPTVTASADFSTPSLSLPPLDPAHLPPSSARVTRTLTMRPWPNDVSGLHQRVSVSSLGVRTPRPPPLSSCPGSRTIVSRPSPSTAPHGDLVPPPIWKPVSPLKAPASPLAHSDRGSSNNEEAPSADALDAETPLSFRQFEQLTRVETYTPPLTFALMTFAMESHARGRAPTAAPGSRISSRLTARGHPGLEAFSSF